MLMNGLCCIPFNVTALLLSGIPVYATGSRHFGGASDTSDWDFFTKFSSETIKVLVKMDYREVPKTSNYTDVALIALYEHDGGLLPKIQIQLVEDEVERNQCQQYLRSRFGSRISEIPKDLRSELWDMAHELVRLHNGK